MVAVSGSTIIVGSNTNYSAPIDSAYPPGLFVSHNMGRLFRFQPAPLRLPYTTGADPSAAVAGSGTVFFSYLGETPAYCSSGSSAVLLTASYDAGRNFRTPTIVDSNTADDKPSLSVQSIPHGKAHLFETWTRWHGNSSEIWFARSLNGGASFSSPRRMYGSAGSNFGSASVVSRRGHVWVFWSNTQGGSLTSPLPSRILEVSSSDDGAHFGKVHSATPRFQSVPRMASPGYLRNLTAPAVAMNRSGIVYLAWPSVHKRLSNGSVDADIWLEHSVSSGWSKPLRVNDVRRGDRFMPSIAVLRDGTVAASFYDRRRGSLDLEAARVSLRHGGQHVGPNVRINQRWSPISDIYFIKPGTTCFSPGRFFGDYIGAAAGPGNSVCLVWADTQLHHPDETDLWFARTTLPLPRDEARRVR
ncbi:MAG: hypothetical protein ACREP2_12235 [Rhodanobacteraceae bacterium]